MYFFKLILFFFLSFMYCESFINPFRSAQYQNCGQSTLNNCNYRLIYPIIQAPIHNIPPPPPPSAPEHIENIGYYGVTLKPSFSKPWFSNKPSPKLRLSRLVECYPLIQGNYIGSPYHPNSGFTGNGYHQNLEYTGNNYYQNSGYFGNGYYQNLPNSNPSYPTYSKQNLPSEKQKYSNLQSYQKSS